MFNRQFLQNIRYRTEKTKSSVMRSDKVMKQDRRVQKTKVLLFKALATLIQRKGYEAITIQEIIDEANVGRSTFYSHYENKEQLLFSGIENLFADLMPSKKNKGLSVEVKIELIYRHAGEHCQIAKALFVDGSPEFVKNHIFNAMLMVVQQTSENTVKQEEKLIRKFIQESIAMALVHLLLSWLKADMPLSTEVMVKQSKKLINLIN